MDGLVREPVKNIPEYIPGKTPKEPGVVKLASNENPFGPSPKALEAIADEAKKLQIYPDQKSSLLREALAKKFGLADQNVICGNGSDDLLQIIGATYLNPGDEVIIAKNTFSVYELVSRIFDGKMVFVGLKDYSLDLEAIAAAITPKTKIVFLTNPNNPTGTIFTAAQFDALMKKVPENVLVVVDEAYAEFVESRDFPDAVKYIKAGRNVLVLRTLSKFYGLAGLRLGYALGPQELIAPMFKTKMPFNVNRLAQAGGLAALGDKEFLDKTYKNNAEGKQYLYAEFDKLKLEYKKTEANFIFIDLKKSADELFMTMMKKGVIVRPLSSFGLPQAIRISIGTRDQNEKLAAALKESI
ncbi:histidinol-phosphate transaminase [candidate division WOR-1 bacterium RIFCSPHIGHO2_01_FULL_53_15]|uniref:Histidinol-phosphate aminotransferase n=1 Tax=candidate division WOR-1 bacterium RIFCSPHIGHO2_01_FULL_53_15 TaxID=1802564 RepID=A0A1F4PZ79_UNCSA|nr:MAG: histidinol-phosphate transaminase [candidate division WOR-1 bacterium RIFCSPHIGHO2_01_FULL_53_15]OGC10633.1 MAG: histidinol-phosphate transaminase [candidate division WOR-1 bacterium RIFCSPHIGHO2_02_FULL_53_26]